MIDLDPIRAFLEPRHEETAAAAAAFTDRELAGEEEPADDEAARRRARELVGAMGEAGLYEPIRARDLRGGCLVRETLAAASPLADAVWALQGLSTTPLLLAGDDAQRGRWVDALASGRAMGAFAMTEPEAGTDVASMRTRAERTEDGWRIDGEKTLISNAGLADLYVTFATTDADAGSRGIGCFLVPADTPGLELAEAQVMAAPHPLGRMTYDGCRVPEDALVGAEGEGFKTGMATLDRLRPTVGAAACGMATRALEEAMDHAAAREQFGRPLAEFQLVKEKLGRTATELTAARLLVYRAAAAGDQGAGRITTEAAMAKSFATEAAQRAVDEAVQILGGRGVLADHPVDRLYRSVRALRIYEGTTEIQRLVIADRLLADRAARKGGSEATAGSGGEGGRR